MVRREHRRPYRLDIARRRDPGRAGEDDPAGGRRPASLGTRDAGQDAGCARRRTARPGRVDQDVEDPGPSRAGADPGPAYRRDLVVAARLWPRRARRITAGQGHRVTVRPSFYAGSGHHVDGQIIGPGGFARRISAVLKMQPLGAGPRGLAEELIDAAGAEPHRRTWRGADPILARFEPKPGGI